MDLINPDNLRLTYEQLMLSLPYFLLLFGAMAALLLGVTDRFADQLMTKAVTVGTCIAAVAAVAYVWGEPSSLLYNSMLAADAFSNVFNVLFLVVTALVAVSSFDYLDRQGIQLPEFYSLLMFSCLGMMLLASALDLVVLFVALEIMSIAVYVLVGFRRVDVRSNEAALKYFILGSAASAVLLYGVALVYGATGSMNLLTIAQYARSSGGSNALFVLGSVLIAVGFLFKVAAAPFHMWMPDVYEGAPATITSFMTTGLKAAAFASFVRVFSAMGYLDPSRGAEAELYRNALWVIAALTMVLGNVVALTQNNIKRMLAYSSISHTGYLIVGMLAAAATGSDYSPVIVYLIAYATANLGAFAVVSHLAGKSDSYTDVHDFAGLGFKRPVLGAAMMVFMLSMAGVPPTGGFIGKYLMFSAAVQGGEIWLTVIAVLCSAVSAYYYLRIIVMMYMKDPAREFPSGSAWGASLVAVLALVATLQMGVLPSTLLDVARQAAQNVAKL